MVMFIGHVIGSSSNSTAYGPICTKIDMLLECPSLNKLFVLAMNVQNWLSWSFQRSSPCIMFHVNLQNKNCPYWPFQWVAFKQTSKGFRKISFKGLFIFTITITPTPISNTKHHIGGKKTVAMPLLLFLSLFVICLYNYVILIYFSLPLPTHPLTPC